MRILHICNSDTNGGAARAALNLCKSLRERNVDSDMFVQRKFSGYDFIHSAGNSFIPRMLNSSRIFADRLFSSVLANDYSDRFSFPHYGYRFLKSSFLKEYDILHLHWINEGFFSLGTLDQLFDQDIPVVWTMHDMWPFTGGCHYSLECRKYETECTDCPALRCVFKGALANLMQLRKTAIYQSAELHFISPSVWLADAAIRSSILNDFRIETIPNALDISKFRPIAKAEAKKSIGVDSDSFSILFNAYSLSEKRKGLDLLKETIELIIKEKMIPKEKLVLLVLGKGGQEIASAMDIRVKLLGRISGDDNLAMCYNAADVFAAPSVQDNLPNTVMESLSCGTPAVAFNIGGMPDMINHKSNGYLADPFSIEDFAKGISWIYNSRTDSDILGQNARRSVAFRFTYSIVSGRHLEFYDSIL